MSDIYVLEPPTNGKVIFHTSHGAIDIELWSKECPKTCESFLKRCIEGFYDNTIFHRIVPKFLIETGNETSTVQSEIFESTTNISLEFHPRLKFRYRGLVGLVPRHFDLKSLNKKSYDPEYKKTSNFSKHIFFTLGPTPFLNQKSILFGKVTGKSLYNLLNLAECPIIETTGKPENPPKINSVEILYSPFEIYNSINVTSLTESTFVANACPPIKSNTNLRQTNLISIETDDFKYIDSCVEQNDMKKCEEISVSPKIFDETLNKAHGNTYSKEQLKRRVLECLQNPQNDHQKSKISNLQASELNLKTLYQPKEDYDSLHEMKTSNKRCSINETSIMRSLKKFQKKVCEKESDVSDKDDESWFKNKLKFGVDSSRAFEY